MNHYDLIVIGGGPGGYHAAKLAGKAGLKTALFEENKLGGVCLNEGCIPTKTLLNSAKIFDYVANTGYKYGVTCSDPQFDHQKVIERKNKVSKKLCDGVAVQVKAAGVSVIPARATIMEKNASGFVITADNQEYTATNVIVATGSSSAVPPLPGLKEALEHGFAVTSREMLNLDLVPNELVIVGGGVIGLEFASYFATAGSHVTVIEQLNKIGGPMEAELSVHLQKIYEKKNITFLLGASVCAVGEGSITYELNGNRHELSCDKVLVSVGRRPNTNGLGLESVNTWLERGMIKVDEHMQTNVFGLYAVGDCNGKLMLAHTAYRQAEVAVNSILGISDAVNYDAIPSVIYTSPEVAWVGLNSEQAKKRGIAFKEIVLPMEYSGRFVAENEGQSGVFKLLIDKRENIVIGAHAIANYSAEFIEICTLMIQSRLKITELKQLTFPHPTVCEIIKEALMMT